jgi:Protein of Unknown function (DUF2784)
VSAADHLLALHFLVVLFVVGGLVLTWIGGACGWAWVRNPWFRYAHLGAIACIALEAVIGMSCPLTEWESALRGGARAESFVGQWMQRLLYYRAPEWTFTTLYLAWAAATLATLRRVPPRRRG